jgi:hypothetical protein
LTLSEPRIDDVLTLVIPAFDEGASAEQAGAYAAW